MSFGFGVGDLLAALHLFEQVGKELRNYRDAPVRFQQLQGELELLRKSLLQVLHTQPADIAEARTWDCIWAITIHCHGPLQTFLDKMHSAEASLGHFRTEKNA